MPTNLIARTDHWAILTALLLVTILLSACTIPQELLIQPPAHAPISAHLQAALTHSPASTEYFAFTNWSVLKEVAGVGELTSDDPLDDRVDFILPLGQEAQALGSLFANSHFLDHAENWGWDNTDLLWEANLTMDGPPVYLLRFREDFDFAPIFARLHERGYSVTEQAGATLYSHAMEMSWEWLTTSDFAILNIAYLADEKLFILSSSQDTVTTVLGMLADGMTLAALPGVSSVAAALGDTGAAILSPLGCQLLDVASVVGGSSAILEALRAEMDRSGISGLYTVFGLGYLPPQAQAAGEEATLPLGILVHHYPIAAQAHADLEPRRTVAQTASSLAVQTPYAELFEVVDARVVETSGGGANLILALHALERAPQHFFRMFYQRDLLFSACAPA